MAWAAGRLVPSTKRAPLMAESQSDAEAVLIGYLRPARRPVGRRHWTPSHRTARALAAAAAMVEREFVSAGYAIERQTYLAGGQEVSNLIAELPGSGRTDEIVVVGAHYDTVPTTPEPTTTPRRSPCCWKSPG